MKLRSRAAIVAVFLSCFGAGQALACSATTPCINEILLDPPGTGDATTEYVELRFSPGATFTSNTYLVAIEGDHQNQRNPGTVDTVIDLSGLSFGSNGFLVVLPAGNTYSVRPGAATITSTSNGFAGLPDGRWTGSEGAVTMERLSTSYFLVEAAARPAVGTDLDTDDDGVLDIVPWTTVFDSIGIAGPPHKTSSYAALNFRHSGTGETGASVELSFRSIYIARNGDSFGSAPEAWVATPDLGGANPDWLLSATATYPNGYEGLPLNHIGTTNAWLDLAPVVQDQAFSIPENSPNGTVVGTVAATDGDSLLLTYAFDPPSAQFAIAAASGQITVADGSALDFETTPTFTVTVRVTDGNDNTDTAVVTINLTDVVEGGNAAPVLGAGQVFSIPENSPNGTTVGQVLATDADGDPITYAFTPASTAFAISTSGLITVLDTTQLDFETTPSFSPTVTVSDATSSGSGTVTINLTNVGEGSAPTLGAGQSFSIPENSPNGTTVGQVAATDGEGDPITYAFDPASTAFAISSSGLITVLDTAQLDFETTPSFSLSVTVSDGTSSGSGTVTINLTNVGEGSAPTLGAGQSFSIPENSPNGTTVGQVAATDGEGDPITYAFDPASTAFAVSASGLITVLDTAQLDFETTPSFSLSVTASDGTSSGSGTVTINLTDVAEGDPAPTVVSVTRAGANPATGSPVQFTATFSENVTGVDSTDFAAVATGAVTGAGVTSVNCVNAACTVTVAFSGDSGTLRLDVVDDDTIRDASNQPLGGAGAGNGNFTGEVYDVEASGGGDTTPPTVVSVTRANPSPSPGPTVSFNVTFSESVTGVELSDFQLTLTGALVTPALQSVTGGGASYTVTVSTGAGTGTIRLDVVDDDSIADGAALPLGGAGTGNGAFTTGEVYQIDTINGIPIFKDGFEDPPAT